MALAKKGKKRDDERRVLTAEGWLRRMRVSLPGEPPKPLPPKKSPTKRASAHRGRPKKATSK